MLAPLFVWFELLFLLGYRKKLAAEVNARVQANILAWRQQEKENGPTGDAKAPLLEKDGSAPQ